MRSFLNGFLTVFLIIATLILFLSLVISNVVTSNISNILSKDYVKDYIVNYIVDRLPDGDYDLDKVEEKINDSKEIDSITDEYYKTLIKDIKNKTTSEVSVSKKLDNLLDKSLEETDLLDEQKDLIKSKFNDNNLNKLYRKLLNTIRDDLENTNVIKVYNYVMNEKFRNGLIIANIVLLILLIIINKSLFKTFIHIGLDLIISGLISFLIFPPATAIVEKFLEQEVINSDIKINTLDLMKPGAILVGIGFIFIIMYIIYKAIKRKGDKYENR